MQEFQVHRFDRFEVRPAQRQLFVAGKAAALGARAFDLLLTLIERRGELVTKRELLDAVWPGLVVEENNLVVQVGTLRRLLGADVIATIPGRGYCFAATPVPATDGDGAGNTSPPAPNASANRRTRSAEALPALIGRENELDDLSALLREHRLVSVVGAGGIGKTHLVRHLLQRHSRRSADAACFVDLSGIQSRDAGQLPRAVASAVGIQLGAGDPSRGLAQALAARSLLLALDNAEHVVESVAHLAQCLLDAGPGIQLVVTSQAPLAIASERVLRLGGLSLPAGQVDAAHALAHGAIALFVDRAQALDRHFTLTDESVNLAAAVCRRLDGMALAIELAAARVQTLGLRGLADALEQRFSLLTSGRRLAPARQQTLHAALDWSHELLSPAEQTVFRRLGIFIGSFALETAQRVASDEQLDTWAVLDALTGLVDRSLVTPTGGDPPRYRLLDTPRAYARERLQLAGEEFAIARCRALALCERFTRADADCLDGRIGVDAFRHDAQADLADGREALAWAAQHEPRAAVALAPCLDWALVNEPAAERRALWELTTGLLDGMPTALQSRWWTGWTQWASFFRGKVLGGDAQRGIDEVRRLGDRQALYWLLRVRLWTLTIAAVTNRTVVDESERCIREMRALEDASWPPFFRHLRMRAESEHCCILGDWEGAIRWLRRAVALAAEAGDSRARHSAMVALVDAELCLQRHDDAARDASELVEALQGTRFESTLTLARQNLMLAHVHRRDFAAARAVAAQAWPLSVRFERVGLLSNNLALLAALEGRPAQAALLAGYADGCNARVGDRQGNETRAVREAERMAVEALGAGEVAGLMAEGALLTEADVKRLALGEDRGPDSPAS